MSAVTEISVVAPSDRERAFVRRVAQLAPPSDGRAAVTLVSWQVAAGLPDRGDGAEARR